MDVNDEAIKINVNDEAKKINVNNLVQTFLKEKTNRPPIHQIWTSIVREFKSLEDFKSVLKALQFPKGDIGHVSFLHMNYVLTDHIDRVFKASNLNDTDELKSLGEKWPRDEFIAFYIRCKLKFTKIDTIRRMS